MSGPDPVIVEGADRLERAEDAELTVVAAARRHGIEVRAHHHRRERLGARPLAEDVPHAVYPHGEAGRAHPRHHAVPRAAVLVGQSQPGEASLRGLADAGELFQGQLESPPIDLHADPLRARGRDSLVLYGTGAPGSEPDVGAPAARVSAGSGPAPRGRAASRRAAEVRCATASAGRTFSPIRRTATPAGLIAGTTLKIHPTGPGSSATDAC